MAEETGRTINLLNNLIQRRDAERERVRKSIKVIDGDRLPVENNLMGLYRWYLHPDIQTVALRNALFWVQEIPPGSCSGKQKGQGGRIHFVWEGKGHTVIDGESHEWEQGDIILLPLKSQGTEHQHFNDDPDNIAKLVAVEPNWYDALGVDMGSGFEILDPSPDYRP